MKNYLLVALSAILLGGATSYVVVNKMMKGEDNSPYIYSDEGIPQVRNVNFSGEYPDFTYAAETSVQAVVFVMVVKEEQRVRSHHLFLNTSLDLVVHLPNQESKWEVVRVLSSPLMDTLLPIITW